MPGKVQAPNLSPRNFARLSFAAIALAALGAKCNGPEQVDLKDLTKCQTNQAVVRVMDMRFQNLCGCQESAGQYIEPPATLTCTVNAGTTVIFLYLGDTYPHLIRHTDPANVFQDSFPYSPDGPPAAGHPVTFSTAGTYPFEDAYQLNLTGQVIVL